MRRTIRIVIREEVDNAKDYAVNGVENGKLSINIGERILVTVTGVKRKLMKQI